MFLLTGASTTYAQGSDLVVYVMAVEIKWGYNRWIQALPRLVVYVCRSPCPLTPCMLGCVAFVHVLEPVRINFLLAWNSWGYFSWKGLFGRHGNSFILEMAPLCLTWTIWQERERGVITHLIAHWVVYLWHIQCHWVVHPWCTSCMHRLFLFR